MDVCVGLALLPGVCVCVFLWRRGGGGRLSGNRAYARAGVQRGLGCSLPAAVPKVEQSQES